MPILPNDLALKLACACLGCLALVACSTSEDIDSISYRVEEADFVIRIPASGELEAKNATPISLPATMFQVQTISWLAEENTYVKAGDVIARIDTRYSSTTAQQEGLRIAQEDIKYLSKEKSLEVEEDEITVEAGLLEKEHVLADRFSMQDSTFLSRKEILDNLRNKDFIESRQLYNSWRGGVHNEKSSNELGLLLLEREQIAARQSQYLQIVENAEVTAPHDGLLVLAMNYNQRDKYRPGDILFPGSTFAFIPDLSELQARVYVLETESSGLKAGQRVELTLRAFPDRLISGSVDHVGAISKPREEDNPLKYFESVIRIDTPMQQNWRPGLQLDVNIFALEQESVLTVPSQAIFRQDGKSYVLLRRRGSWIPQEIGIGARNLARTEITSGLAEGDTVALYLPDDFDIETGT